MNNTGIVGYASPNYNGMSSSSTSPSPTVTPTSTAKPTATVAPTTTAPSQVGTKKITIVSGMWSDKVAQELQKLGLIQDAEDFDRYLISNGYADKIRVGTFEIPTDASYEQIAKIITGR